MAKSAMKALELLKSNKTVSERAENYATAVKRNIQRDVIDTLTAKKEGIEDELINIPTPSSSLPADKIPAKAPAKKVDDDEDELRKMADWAS